MHEGVVQIVIDQMVDVQSQHPGLELVLDESGDLRVQGTVGFCVSYSGRTVEDTYQIKLHIPDDYPDSPPGVYETGGKIPEAFEHFMKAGNFCLGVPVEVRRKFAQHKTLIDFINDQVVPYLFSYSYKRDHGQMPFGDRDHGHIGLIEYYQEHFGVNLVTAMMLLKYLADNFAPPLGPCPCGSSRKLKDCHGSKLDDLRPHYRPEWFEQELRGMIEMARGADIPLPEQDVMPKRMWRKHQSRRRRKTHRG